MKKKSVLLMSLFVFFLISTSSSYGVADTFLNIKIGGALSKNGSTIVYSDTGFNIYEKNNTSSPVFIINSKELKIETDDMGQMILTTLKENESYPMENFMIGSKSSSLKLGSKKYRGYIYFIDKSSTIQPINYVDIDDYLYGVLSKEVGHGFPKEALKAQAVASRSFAYTNRNKHKSEGFNLCDTTHCQVYGGMNSEHKNLNEAVDSTRNQYAYYNGNVAQTTFHSNNGGYMESSKNEWGGHIEYLVHKEDPYSKDVLNSNWSVNTSMVELESKLKSAGVNVGKLISIDIVETTEGKRAKTLRVIGTDKETTITGGKLRSAMGLKSSWFTIDADGKTNTEVLPSPETNKKEDVFIYNNKTSATNVSLVQNKAIDASLKEHNLKDEYFIRGNIETKEIKKTKVSVNKPSVVKPMNGLIINGHGYGHGVGMSQLGAVTMAKEGFTYIDILKHYYPGVEIR